MAGTLLAVLLVGLVGDAAALRFIRTPPPAAGQLVSRRAVSSVTMQTVAPAKPDIQLAPTEPKQDPNSNAGKKFKLLLFNDNVNRREYVAKILQASVPGLTQADAYVVMQKAHKSGMAVVGVWVFELAEAYCDSLKAGGLIAAVTEEE